MIARRDVLMGGACLVGAGGAWYLKPRKHLNLLAGRKMDAIVPARFGPWVGQSDTNLIQPVAEGSLADRLYSQSVTRIYLNEVTRDEIMVLIAYGDNQSDLLQLHRPEACYPAVGFRLVLSAPANVPLGDGAILPVRRVTADRTERRENIVYWTRLGEYLPTNGTKQGEARLAMAMRGYVADGMLFRCSKVGVDDATNFAALEGFIAELVRATAPRDRPALVGSELAKAIKT